MKVKVIYSYVKIEIFYVYKCNKTKSLDKRLLKATDAKGCENIQAADTIEIHWVHSSCDIEPGAGLGSCLSDKCANPQLRVEAQVYVLVNDSDAKQLSEYNLASKKSDGYHQAQKLPDGSSVEFLGSTTGPSYSQSKCSPLQVTWNVRKSCEQMDINSVHAWCKNNKFAENKAHGVRKLVTDPRLLSEIE